MEPVLTGPVRSVVGEEGREVEWVEGDEEGDEVGARFSLAMRSARLPVFGICCLGVDLFVPCSVQQSFAGTEEGKPAHITREDGEEEAFARERACADDERVARGAVSAKVRVA